MKLFDLTGRVAVVTGGNGGLGLGMAKGLAEAGAKLVLVGRNAAKGRAALAELDSADAVFEAADVTKKAACEALVAATLAKFGRLDILINNAGISVRKQPQDYTEADWHAVLDSNLTSAFLLSQAAYPALKVNGGKIINIGSIMSVLGAPYSAAYAASKGGIVQLTKALAAAWAPDHIQVNAILPGWIDTDMTVTARAQVDGLHAHVLARTPAGRWGRAEDLAGAAVFLASDNADFVTGAGFKTKIYPDFCGLGRTMVPSSGGRLGGTPAGVAPGVRPPVCLRMTDFTPFAASSATTMAISPQ
jgi:2-deoxy-D-gluconate 3-dehydrogenase